MQNQIAKIKQVTNQRLSKRNSSGAKRFSASYYCNYNVIHFIEKTEQKRIKKLYEDFKKAINIFASIVLKSYIYQCYLKLNVLEI